mgnify:CR=1 FL=1
MSKPIPFEIRDFSGGNSTIVRGVPTSLAQNVTNFDIYSDPHKLAPLRDLENGDSAASTSTKKNFTMAYWSSTPSWRLFSLGVVSGSGKAEILMKTLGTGGSNDLGDSGWATPANNQSASGSTSFNLFTFYKKTGKIYGAKAGTTIWTFTPDGSTAFDDSHHALAYTNIANGLVKNNILWIPYDNKIASLNDTTWTDVALTLPEEFYITSICDYGNFIAIAAAPLNSAGNSRVYIWDMDSALSEMPQTVDWGTGQLKILDNLGGLLVGVSLDAGQNKIEDKIVFRYLSGSYAKIFRKLSASSTTAVLPIVKQVINGRLYFLLSGTFNGTARSGLWSVGMTDAGNYSISQERYVDNSGTTTNIVLFSFAIVGDYVFISYTDNSTFTTNKSNDQASYTATSLYETVKLDMGDPDITKKLLGVTVMTEPLPAAGSYTLKYRKDAESSWTTIFTHATDDSISHDAINIESTGVTLPEFKEIQFRIESTGGAVITGLKGKVQVTEKTLY